MILRRSGWRSGEGCRAAGAVRPRGRADVPTTPLDPQPTCSRREMGRHRLRLPGVQPGGDRATPQQQTYRLTRSIPSPTTSRPAGSRAGDRLAERGDRDEEASIDPGACPSCPCWLPSLLRCRRSRRVCSTARSRRPSIPRSRQGEGGGTPCGSSTAGIDCIASPVKARPWAPHAQPACSTRHRR